MKRRDMDPLTLDRQRNSFFLSLSTHFLRLSFCHFVQSVFFSILFVFLSLVCNFFFVWVKAITFAWFAFRPNKKLKKNRHWGWNSPKNISWFLTKTSPQQKHLGEFHLGVERLGSRRQKVEEIFFWKKRKCFKKGKKELHRILAILSRL